MSPEFGTPGGRTDHLPPAAKALATDIAVCDPDVMRACETLIDDGFHLPFGEA